MIQQFVLTIQIEMIFPVEISQKTSDGPLQLLLIKLKIRVTSLTPDSLIDHLISYEP